MGAYQEWLIYAPQSALGTFNTTASEFFEIPAITGSLAGNWTIDDEQTLQKARGMSGHQLGALAPSGEINTKLYASNMVELFGTFMRKYVKQTDTPSAGSYTYGMRYDDDLDLTPLSLQYIYRDTVRFATSAMAISVLGAIVNSWKIESAVDAAVKLTIGWMAKDRALSSDDSAGDNLFWNYSPTTNTPNVIAVGSIDTLPAERPMWFFDAVLTRGGTLTYNPTTGITAVDSPTTVGNVTSLSIEVDHGLDEAGFEIGSDRTRVAFCPGNREITVGMDIRWCDESTTLYALAEAGTAFTLQAKFALSATRVFEIIIPEIFVTPIDLPDVSGDKSVRSYSLEAKAQTKAVTNTTSGTTSMDIGLQIVSGDNI